MRVKRCWMTGCMALVLLVAGRGADATEREEGAREPDDWVTLSSPLSAEETVRRLRRAAERRGLAVVAEVKPAATDTKAAVLVLGTEDGHTPMLQEAQAPLPELPLQLVVEAAEDGSSRVSYRRSRAWLRNEGLPEEWRARLARLPQVVATLRSRQSGVNGLS